MVTNLSRSVWELLGFTLKVPHPRKFPSVPTFSKPSLPLAGQVSTPPLCSQSAGVLSSPHCSIIIYVFILTHPLALSSLRTGITFIYFLLATPQALSRKEGKERRREGWNKKRNKRLKVCYSKIRR